MLPARSPWLSGGFGRFVLLATRAKPLGCQRWRVVYLPFTLCSLLVHLHAKRRWLWLSCWERDTPVVQRLGDACRNG